MDISDSVKTIFSTSRSSINSNEGVPVVGANGTNNGTGVGCITIGNLASQIGNTIGANKRSEFIDMGLPSGRLWASKNLGAETIVDYGAYFSWGNVKGQKPNGTTFTTSWGSSVDGEPYVSSEGHALTGNIPLQQDAANFYLGGTCRMPTKEEFQELFNSTYTKYVDASGTEVTGTDKRVTLHGVLGILLESRVNGNWLFFPCAGYGSGQSLYVAGSHGYYWSSSFSSSARAYSLGFGSGGVGPADADARYYGFSVRAVQ